MTDYAKLKRLLDACRAEKCVGPREFSKAVDALFEVCSIETIAELVAENERLGLKADSLEFAKWSCQVNQEAIRAAGHETIDDLAAERDQLKADNEHARMRIKELDLMFGRYLLGMRSAVIEWRHGQGADAAMQWIWNGLLGPGELPPADETQAQAYFDREIVAVDAGLEEMAVFFDARRAAKQVTP